MNESYKAYYIANEYVKNLQMVNTSPMTPDEKIEHSYKISEATINAHNLYNIYLESRGDQ